ncbi:malto-oligosyltrehalose synthase [Actinacidiphila oryziradicis]|uniref:Malto-oligosyltrehalose synthase n=1 Tax=Actinacidiphila oryziradicis TaxID=2571141 RepID=A0A4U0RV35_9ACTN|nr:malto-oligosyltrehalose synthase [Actinacidiphila oryziradicis]TJZ99367.1 malto-oligosyltrehalose synthase [Actinacidiphila oryziradicis]
MASLIRPARTAPTTPGVPTATYRLQLQPDFPFAAAEAVVPHLAALGVSHLHLSPVLEAVPGSTHGYDVVDHTLVREELGGEDGLRALSRTARAHGLGLVLDLVPNHMAVPAPEHLARPLWSVLREGPESPYARWFDIDWQAQGGKVLLPVLGAPLEDIQGEGGLQLGKHAGEPVLRYYEHAFPLRPGTEQLRLPELLEAQWYRLAWWRQAGTDINYRRFFTISELIAVRVEDPEVFAATHATLLRLLRDGVADGLRIDHPDGLADPAGYLGRLSEACGGRWTVVEKILTGDEPLPDGWACAGTTGYDALDRIDGLFTDPAGADRITAFYREFTGQPDDLGGAWAPTVRRAAYRLVTHDLAAEVDRLARAAGPAVSREAIREVLVRIPVYRPYVLPGVSAPEESVAMVTAAARDAAVPGADAVRDLALGRLGRGPGKDDFAIRFAQVSSALRAKSVEDTAFYRYGPLLSLNEVGRDPARPAVSPAGFHAFCARLQRDWPTTGTVLSTHDTKRSAEVRARLAALSEVPDLWAGSVPRDTVEPHVAYQAWQYAVVFAGRTDTDGDVIAATMLKSEREAGLRTSWTEQDPAYEARLAELTREVVSRPAGAIARAIEGPAIANALGATLVHLTMPGVPDIYQGDEERQLLLVDPANRAPYVPRPAAPESPKRLVTTTALRLRREHPEWFGASATYEPLPARGPAAGHCLAFVRTGRAVTVVTRLSRRLLDAGGWRGTVLPLPEGEWRDLLTDRPHSGGVPLEELLDRHPVALLTLQQH